MIIEPLDLVRQTGNTIIFEEFNKEKMDLATLLTRDDHEIPVAKFAASLMGAGSGQSAELVVKSFEEFVEKFAPTIYETVVRMEDGTARFVYELEKPRYECTEILLKDHAFYKMIMALMNRKASTDKGNMEFPYDDLKRTLTPESELEESKRIRKNLQSNMDEYMKLIADGEPSVEADRYAQNIEACRDKIISKYQNKSPLALIPLLIADKQNQIDKLNALQEGDEEGEQRMLPCSYSLDNQGNLLLIEQSVSDDYEDKRVTNTGNGSAQLVAVIKDDFQEFAPAAIRDNDYITDLIVNVFVPGGTSQLAIADKMELEASKKQFQDIYKSSLESFSKAVSSIVEKFAGVKTFFDHAAYKGRLAKDTSVIIANCKIDAILNNELARTRFRNYFTQLSAEKDVNRIWFGVIPAIAYGMEISDNGTGRTRIDPFSTRRNTGTAATKKTASGLVSLEAVKEMLKLLEEARIMTFVSYKGSEKTGFSELTAQQIHEYMKNFESVNSEYAVFAYPNFTILPKEKNAVKIGTELIDSEEKNSYVTIPGIYLDAAYVAAGMMVGMQNYELLKAAGYNVKPKYPCVRFDIEEGDNAKMILTKLNRETTTEMEQQTKDAIMEDRFGFVFADNKIVYNGVVLNNSYVLNARTLKRGSNGKFRSIYKTLVRILVDQLLRTTNDYVTQKSVERFISDYADSWRRDNKDEAKKYANRILLEGESIELDPEKHKLVVKFNKEEEVWDDIVINDTESEE